MEERSVRGRWPRSEARRAARRRLLDAAAEYRRARERRRYGTLGTASRGRHVDPATLTAEERERLGLVSVEDEDEDHRGGTDDKGGPSILLRNRHPADELPELYVVGSIPIARSST